MPGLGRRFQQLDLLTENEALAAHAFDRDGNDLPVLDQLLAQRGATRGLRQLRIRLRPA